ncbi:MAG: hypothetical protein NVS4B2_25280 [Chloroflexota bacterium]
MSPRAAWRLESLGFAEVYDYGPGQADWFACGLPLEGAGATLTRASGVAQRDIPRCTLTEHIGDVRARVHAPHWSVCAVVNEETIVLGLLRARDLDADPTATVEMVMRSGPATYRPDAFVPDVLERLHERGVAGVLVTRSDATLVGWLSREDAERAMNESSMGRAVSMGTTLESNER